MKKEKTDYNIRIVDNGDGTFELGFVSRLKTKGLPKDIAGEWVSGSVRKMVRLLKKGILTKWEFSNFKKRDK